MMITPQTRRMGPHRVELCVLVYKTSPQKPSRTRPKVWLSLTVPVLTLTRRKPPNKCEHLTGLDLNECTQDKYIHIHEV